MTGGLVLGACPIVDAVCLKSHGRRPIKGFYVRKEAESRGTGKMIAVVDRGEGAEENLWRHEVELVPLFSLADFVPARRPGT